MADEIRNVEVRTASEPDIRLFYPDGPPRSGYSWIAFYKGQPACLAGVTIEPRRGFMAFSEMKPVDAPKITVWRTAKVLFSHIKTLNLPMYAACELSDKMAQSFVKRLGFRYEREFQGMELFKCRE